MVLRQNNHQHYQLFPVDKTWLINIYPGNQRLYHDVKKRGPFLELRGQVWALIDVVKEDIKAQNNME